MRMKNELQILFIYEINSVNMMTVRVQFSLYCFDIQFVLLNIVARLTLSSLRYPLFVRLVTLKAERNSQTKLI